MYINGNIFICFRVKVWGLSSPNLIPKRGLCEQNSAIWCSSSKLITSNWYYLFLKETKTLCLSIWQDTNSSILEAKGPHFQCPPWGNLRSYSDHISQLLWRSRGNIFTQEKQTHVSYHVRWVGRRRNIEKPGIIVPTAFQFLIQTW